ncbi:hypothetical protein AMS69_11870 [Haloarcula rubripromontorii]|uniref:Uncharacterized protein n=1 Tax=Haloarcula rubripromontorii TaxID=1705562 RepID=A0A0M9ALA4_9EURY|nr:hypothetical protein [Haloarcula rubripromontorii]KOX93135.1 hypothetical protein AMS69_11870 [Haloarcula rubripromontorii]
MPHTTRRQMLFSLVPFLPIFAGCTQFEGESGEETGHSETEPTTAASETEAVTATAERPTTGQTLDAEELDLREANVVGVELADKGGDDYRFDVTLYHDDDGEDGYANWWQVETPAGDQLGRRDLRHAHSTAPFARSATITVPDDVGCVVVRGHDQTHGYGGQAITVAVPGGATQAIQQGSERRSVTEADCP